MDVTDIDKYIAIGMKDKMWYQECEETLVEIYGREKLVLVTNLLAATSIGSSLKSNLQLFRKALHQLERDLPFVGYLPGIKFQLDRIRKGEELSGRKIRSFARAMSGDTQAVVVDRWLLRAFKMDRQYKRNTGPHAGKILSGGATDKQYTAIEEWVRNRAFEMEMEPRQLSAIIWSGVRISMSGDRETHYKTVLKLKLYNMYDKS